MHLYSVYPVHPSLRPGPYIYAFKLSSLTPGVHAYSNKPAAKSQAAGLFKCV